ncbi:hypothetical protein BSKO_09735 [Bryopsis sp. KO-2023]|nr:hypothetical protein BSKO_09735 [Bryopsis sp. KO-2023]
MEPLVSDFPNMDDVTYAEEAALAELSPGTDSFTGDSMCEESGESQPSSGSPKEREPLIQNMEDLMWRKLPNIMEMDKIPLEVVSEDEETIPPHGSIGLISGEHTFSTGAQNQPHLAFNHKKQASNRRQARKSQRSSISWGVPPSASANPPSPDQVAIMRQERPYFPIVKGIDPSQDYYDWQRMRANSSASTAGHRRAASDFGLMFMRDHTRSPSEADSTFDDPGVKMPLSARGRGRTPMVQPGEASKTPRPRESVVGKAKKGPLWKLCGKRILGCLRGSDRKKGMPEDLPSYSDQARRTESVEKAYLSRQRFMVDLIERSQHG